MPLYYFRIGSGQYGGASDHGIKFSDDDGAWDELTRVCGDLVGGICRKINQNSEWQKELLDESKKPLFKIAIVAKTFDR
jgi:hypothetical protein